MSYLGAADQAHKAAAAAHASKNHTTEYKDRKLAESIEHLSKAIEELATELHRDSD